MNKKLFIGLSITFFAAVIIGTLTHELGHYIVAKYFGYETKINFAKTFWRSPDPNHPIIPYSPIAMTLGGPLQTIITGTIGFLLLFFNRKKYSQAKELSVGQWALIFISLFWLRQTVNFCTWIGSYIINGNFSTKGDELVIANYFEIPEWTLITITAIIGVLIFGIITFKFIPSTQRFTFLAAGFIGGIAGYYFWLILFGKYIMP